MSVKENQYREDLLIGMLEDDVLPDRVQDVLIAKIPEIEPWRPISRAPRDGTPIWALMRDDISAIHRPDMVGWDGIQIPLRHGGLVPQGDRTVDLGWTVAAPLGYGGFPDRIIAGWVPLRRARP